MRFALVAVISALVAVGGCGSKKKDKPASVEGLNAVPATANAVIGIDVRKLASQPIVLRAIQRMFARDATLKDEVSAVLSACQFDVAKDLVSATLALVPRADSEMEDSLLVARGRFSESVIVECIQRFWAESNGRLERLELNGRQIYHEISSERSGLWFSFGSPDTLLVSSGQELMAAVVSDEPKMAEHRQGLARLLSRAKTDAGIWGIARIDGSVAAGMRVATGGKVAPAKSAIGFVEFREGVSVVFQAEMATEEDAKTLRSVIADQLQAATMIVQADAAGRLVEKINVSSSQNWTKLAWSLNDAELTDLLKMSFVGGGTGTEDEGVSGSTIDIGGANHKTLVPKSESRKDPKTGIDRETNKNGNKRTGTNRKENVRKQGEARQ